MTSNIEFLHMADMQIRGLTAWGNDDVRLAYLKEVIRPDIVSRMSKEDLEEYNAKYSISKEQIAKQEAEDLIRMSMNKDSSSI